jgi:hypothetical protein
MTPFSSGYEISSARRSAAASSPMLISFSSICAERQEAEGRRWSSGRGARLEPPPPPRLLQTHLAQRLLLGAQHGPPDDARKLPARQVVGRKPRLDELVDKSA